MHDTRRDAVVETDLQPATPPAAFPPIERRPTQAPRDREEDLYNLADLARERGMTVEEWYANQNIGSCPAQVEQRISALNIWLLAHPRP